MNYITSNRGSILPRRKQKKESPKTGSIGAEVESVENFSYSQLCEKRKREIYDNPQ